MVLNPVGFEPKLEEVTCEFPVKAHVTNGFMSRTPVLAHALHAVARVRMQLHLLTPAVVTRGFLRLLWCRVHEQCVFGLGQR